MGLVSIRTIKSGIHSGRRQVPPVRMGLVSIRNFRIRDTQREEQAPPVQPTNKKPTSFRPRLQQIKPPPAFFWRREGARGWVIKRCSLTITEREEQAPPVQPTKNKPITPPSSRPRLQQIKPPPAFFWRREGVRGWVIKRCSLTITEREEQASPVQPTNKKPTSFRPRLQQIKPPPAFLWRREGVRWCRKSGHELRGKMAILSRTGVQNGKQTKKTIHRRI